MPHQHSGIIAKLPCLIPMDKNRPLQAVFKKLSYPGEITDGDIALTELFFLIEYKLAYC